MPHLQSVTQVAHRSKLVPPTKTLLLSSRVFLFIVQSMDFIKKLHSLHLLSGGTALDIGAGELFEAKRLVEAGYLVDAIDTSEPKESFPNISFSLTSIEDCTFSQK